MIYGYCRISTKQQNIERQVRNITSEYKEAVIIKEIFTGKLLSRPEWDKLYKKVKEGDTIVFDSVSRMSRNETEGFTIYEQLYNNNVNLVFLKEPHINTDTYKNALQNTVEMTGTTVDFILEGVNKYLIALAKEQIRLAFKQSQKEVDDLSQRTREGIRTAELNGKQIGQLKGAKLKIKKEQPIKEIILSKSKDFFGTNTDIEVMAIIKQTKYTEDKTNIIKYYNISRNTYYKYKDELKKGELI